MRPRGIDVFFSIAYPDGRVEEVKLRHCNTSQGDTKIVETYRSVS